MKKLQVSIDAWVDKLDICWRQLPVRKQHRYTLYFFLAYLVLTIGVILKVGYDTGKSNNSIVIGHIDNPVLEKKQSGVTARDSISTILKKKIYEKQ